MCNPKESHLKESNVIKVIDNTIERLNKSFDECMSNNDVITAKKYLMYADGVRMLKDNMLYELHSN